MEHVLPTQTVQSHSNKSSPPTLKHMVREAIFKKPCLAAQTVHKRYLFQAVSIWSNNQFNHTAFRHTHINIPDSVYTHRHTTHTSLTQQTYNSNFQSMTKSYIHIRSNPLYFTNASNHTRSHTHIQSRTHVISKRRKLCFFVEQSPPPRIGTETYSSPSEPM